MRALFLFLGAVATFTLTGLTPIAAQDEADDKIEFEEYGFEIKPLEVKTNENTTAIQMFLPPRSGFSANITVQLQYYAGDMNNYINQSVDEIERMGWTRDTVIVDDAAAVILYQGKAGGRELTWYSRMMNRGSTYYLVTATSLTSRWELDRKQLIEVVDSFALTDSK